MSITGFPVYRPRRTRATENLRAMIRETEVSVKDLIYPLFVVPGENVKHEIESLPGNYHWSIDRVMECVDEVVELGYHHRRLPVRIHRAWSLRRAAKRLHRQQRRNPAAAR